MRRLAATVILILNLVTSGCVGMPTRWGTQRPAQRWTEERECVPRNVRCNADGFCTWECGDSLVFGVAGE